MAAVAVVGIAAADALNDRYPMRAAGKPVDFTDSCSGTTIDDVQVIAVRDVNTMRRCVEKKIIPPVRGPQRDCLCDGVERFAVSAACDAKSGAYNEESLGELSKPK